MNRKSNTKQCKAVRSNVYLRSALKKQYKFIGLQQMVRLMFCIYCYTYCFSTLSALQIYICGNFSAKKNNPHLGKPWINVSFIIKMHWVLSSQKNDRSTLKGRLLSNEMDSIKVWVNSYSIFAYFSYTDRREL